jgi:superfamily I DNA/RNA helicase
VPLDLSTLNPAQREAVEHKDGAMLVLAGAGSGKTRVVTYRIGRLIEQGVHQRSILGVTFTNKAAREMKERLVELLGKERARGVTLCTFHSLCARLLRRDGHRIDIEGNFTILDASDQLAQLGRVMKDHDIQSDNIPERMILSRIGWLKNQGLEPHEVDPGGDDLHMLARRLYGPYAKHLRQLGAVDFDDLLLLTKRLLNDAKDVAKRYQQQFQYILIDEYQDTNPIQMALVERLVNEQQNLCVVGDDDQAIYSFRGSAVENILEFDRKFAPCRVVKLEANYRSTPEILACANSVIAHNGTRRDKSLKAHLAPGDKPRLVALDDGEMEADYVAGEIGKAIERDGRQPGDIALLYRANPQSRLFEEQLRLRGIPYKVVGGQEFFERRDVKNVLAYLALIVDGKDELAFRRVINLPARGMGDKATSRLVEEGKAAEADLLEFARHAAWPKPKQQDVLSRFTGPLLDARKALASESPELDPALICERAILAAGLRDAIENERDLAKREKAESALTETLDAVVAWWDRVMEARQFPDVSESWVVDLKAHPLRSFLDRVALDEQERQREREKRKEGEQKKADNRVTLMSIHASKGLEFPLVFLVGFEEGLLPHRRVLEEDPTGGPEEERRLCYVAITRARERLTFTWAKGRRRRRQMVGRKVSRFAGEMEERQVQRLGEEPPKSQEEAAADFFAKMKGL